jgi:mevalonate kinase
LNPEFRKYYSKILLFGEYTLLAGSRALTVPFDKFSGTLEIPIAYSTIQLASNKSLKEFFIYLDKNRSNYPPGLKFAMDQFEFDLSNGLFLNSNIPQGYGVGSSGVLVAAVYAAYAIDPISPEKESGLSILKNYFSFMESYFHGRSSGLDPLSCYSGKPLLISDSKNIEFAHFATSGRIQDFGVFLIDTHITSKTGGLVELFLERSNDRVFRSVLENKIIPRNSNCIHSFLQGEQKTFFDELKMLSVLQFEYFSEMIPSEFMALWEKGMQTGKYYLKLCGSGGGGFLLGFTLEKSNAKDFFSEHDIYWV